MLAGIYTKGVFRAGQRISFIVSQDGSVDLRAHTLSAVPTGSLSSWPDMRSIHIVHDAGARRETTLVTFTKTMTGIVENNGRSRTHHFTGQGFFVNGLGAGAPTTPRRLAAAPAPAGLSAAGARVPFARSQRRDRRRPSCLAHRHHDGRRARTGDAGGGSGDDRHRQAHAPAFALLLAHAWRAPHAIPRTDLRIDAPLPADAFRVRFPEGTYVLDSKPGGFYDVGPPAPDPLR